MIILSAQSVAKHFGERTLFSDINFEINEHDIISLVGKNGVGKTTLFNMILDKESCDEGNFAKTKGLTIGSMEQYVAVGSKTTLYNETLDVFAPLIKIEHEIASVNTMLNHSHEEALIEKQFSLMQSYEKLGGYVYQSRTRSTLIGLGFTENDFDLSVDKLSGGQRNKIALAKLLLSEHNLLLLDEPTNHLDIKSVEWLEDFIKNYSGAILLVSHDRFFLDKVTTRTFEIEHRTINCKNLNYSNYVKAKEVDGDIIRKHYETDMKEVKRLEEMIAMYRKWNKESSVRHANERQKKLDKLVANMVVPDKVEAPISFSFNTATRGATDVLDVNEIDKYFGDKCLYKNVCMYIKRAERVFLLGDNGCGKTTLIKQIIAAAEEEHANVSFGTGIVMGYYDQAQADVGGDNTVFGQINDAYPQFNNTQIRNALASFLFKGDEVFKSVNVLSGGEKARVSLLKLMLSKANFLLLDEPTNHLDIYAREALEKALLDYNGTLLIISHDRYLIEKLADRIYFLDENGMKEFDGNYSYYIKKRLEWAEAPEDKQITVQTSQGNNLDYKQKKQQQAEVRRLKAEIKALETDIDKNNLQVKEYTEKLHNPEIAANFEAVTEISINITNLQSEEVLATSKWADLSEELAELIDE